MVSGRRDSKVCFLSQGHLERNSSIIVNKRSNASNCCLREVIYSNVKLLISAATELNSFTKFFTISDTGKISSITAAI